MFQDVLWDSIHDIWPRIMGHPFLRELHAGTLDRRRFAYFVSQDYAYLGDFARVLALGAARAPGREELRFFLDQAQGVFTVESALHETLARDLEVPPQALGRGPRGPATDAYADFLLHHAFAGDFARLCMAILPCYWVYRRVGEELARLSPSPDPLYRAWIETYAADGYGRSVQAQLRIANRLGEENPARREEFIGIFRRGVQHEWEFWQQAYASADRVQTEPA